MAATAPQDIFTLQATAESAEARVAELSADYARLAESMASIMDDLAAARAAAEKARGRCHLANLRAMLAGK